MRAHIIKIDETSEFASIARQNHLRMKELREIFDHAMTARTAGEALEIPTAERIGTIIKEKNRCARIAVVFAAVAAESFIYSFALTGFSRSYVKRHLEKLDLVSKWVLIPRLIGGVELPQDGQAFELLSLLVKSRNALVHAKTRSFDLAATTFDQLESHFSRHIEQAERAIETLDALITFASTFVQPEFAEAHLGGHEDP